MSKPKCGNCGRCLKDKESIKRGYGPVCFAKVEREQEQIQKKESDQKAAE